MQDTERGVGVLKNAKKPLWSASLLVTIIIAIGVYLILSGALVKPTSGRLARLTEAPEFDRLDWQWKREAEILRIYESGAYTIDTPLVLLDPFEMNPLSALVIYESSTEGTLTIQVEGLSANGGLTYEVISKSPRSEAPIVGLYPGSDNRVMLSVRYKDGTENRSEIRIKTPPLPVDFQTYQTLTTKPELMEPGWTLMIACFSHSYTCVIDPNGMVRGYFSNTEMAHGTSIVTLKNGRLLMTGDEYKQVPYHKTKLWEINWLGKIFREYAVPNGVHHDMQELPNGDILAVSNHKEMFQTGTREDVVILIDRETGLVKQAYDFRNILDERREPVHHFHPNILNPPNRDWMHMNAALFDERDDNILVSSPIQSMIAKINARTSEIIWILGPHEGYEGEFQRFRPFLLTPSGDAFEWFWCQHAPEILPDLDGNPDTLDLLVFDNGQNRSFSSETAVPPSENYSRAVHYRIDEKAKTVQQLWQYGKELGSAYYASFLGDVDDLKKTGNRLITFGGQLYTNDQPCEDIVSGVFGQTVTRSRIIEVTPAGETVYEIAVRENANTLSAETYQAERIPFEDFGKTWSTLGETVAQRVGEPERGAPIKEVRPPLLFTKRLTADFSKFYREGNRLIIDGQLRYDNKIYLIGRAYIVFRSQDDVAIFPSYGGMNGRFFSSVELSALKEGEYLISIAGAVREGNDATSGKMLNGHFLTPYKITIPLDVQKAEEGSR